MCAVDWVGYRHLWVNWRVAGRDGRVSEDRHRCEEVCGWPKLARATTYRRRGSSPVRGSYRTLRRYAKDGRLPDARSDGGRRIFRNSDLDALGGPEEGVAVAYARVSSRRQQAEGDLDRQVDRLRQASGDDLAVFTDVASGLSDRRVGLRKVLAECMKPRVERLLVENPNRLACLGVGVIEHLLAGDGVAVITPVSPSRYRRNLNSSATCSRS